jgi:membrane protein implicated in regulation of membrane protease activity
VDWVTILFLVAGVLLIASEAVHMALVPIFFGLAALIVAGLRGVGLVESIPLSLLVWSIMSVALTIPLRPLARRLIKGQAKYDRSDAVKDALGQVVEVVEDVADDNDNGRIRFQGTTWAARSMEGKLAKGTRAKLFAKDKLVWVVEPLSLLDENNVVPDLSSDLKGAIAKERVK